MKWAGILICHCRGMYLLGHTMCRRMEGGGGGGERRPLKASTRGQLPTPIYALSARCTMDDIVSYTTYFQARTRRGGGGGGMGVHPPPLDPCCFVLVREVMYDEYPTLCLENWPKNLEVGAPLPWTYPAYATAYVTMSCCTSLVEVRNLNWI